MSAFVKSMSLFPESKFWKMGKQSEVKDVFGGCASLVLLAIVMAILGVKLREVFSQTTMNVKSIELVDTKYQSIFSTGKGNDAIKPVIIVIDVPSNLKAEGSFIINDNSSSIALQKCTVDHLLGIEPYSSQFSGNYLCLPLNSSFTLSSNTQLNFFIVCNEAPCSTGGLITFTILSPSANPYQSQSDPWTYASTNLLFSYDNQIKLVTINMKQERISTDYALFPFQKNVNNMTGIHPIVDANTISSPSTSGGSYGVRIKGNKFYTQHQRSFLTVIDAFSYIGGIFNSLIACFFFMSIYSSFLFEMQFTSIFFRKKALADIGFIVFIKQSLYQILKSLGLSLNWKQQEYRQQLQSSISKLMDIIHLQRRIEYLEAAITVILDPHQRKALKLIRKTKQQIDQRYTEHNARTILINFFRNRELRTRQFQKEKEKNGKQKTDGQNGNKQQVEYPPEELMNSKKENAQKDPAGLGTSVEIINNEPNLEQQISFEDDLFIRDEIEEEKNQMNELEVEEKFLKDLIKLMREAENDQRSRSAAIVELLDGKLKKWLKEESKKQYDFRFSYKMSSEPDKLT